MRSQLAEVPELYANFTKSEADQEFSDVKSKLSELCGEMDKAEEQLLGDELIDREAEETAGDVEPPGSGGAGEESRKCFSPRELQIISLMQGGKQVLDKIDGEYDQTGRDAFIAEVRVGLEEVARSIPPDAIIVGREIHSASGTVLTEIDVESPNMVCQVKNTNWSRNRSGLSVKKREQLKETAKYGQLEGGWVVDETSGALTRIAAPMKPLVVRFMDEDPHPAIVREIRAMGFEVQLKNGSNAPVIPESGDDAWETAKFGAPIPDGAPEEDE